MKEYLKRCWGIVLSVVVIIGALFNPTLVWAEDVIYTVNITPQMTRAENGYPLAAEEIAGYRIYYEVDGALNWAQPGYIETTETTYQVVIDLQPRVTEYQIDFGVTVIDADGKESVFSNIVRKTRLVPSTAPPSPPTIEVVSPAEEISDYRIPIENQIMGFG